MAMPDREPDTSANTAQFQAFVDSGPTTAEKSSPVSSTTVLIAAVAALLIALLAVALLVM